MQPITWLGLGYNVPVQPSKNRVYVWRKLKEFGAGYFKQGVAILPKGPQSMAKFSGLAVKIREMGGDAVLVELRFCDPRDEQNTISRFQHQSEAEYQELLRESSGLMADIRRSKTLPSEQNEHLRKVVKRYGKVKSRDYFRSSSQEDIAEGLEDLALDMSNVTDELSKQLRRILDL